MKRLTIYLLATFFLFCGCSSSRLTSYERATIGGQIGSFLGWLFGEAIGNSIDGGRGADLGSAIGYMAGGIAGSAIGYTQEENEAQHQEQLPEKEEKTSSSVSIPHLNIEACFAGNDEAVLDAPIYAGSEDWISFIIENEGNYAAYDVKPIVKIERGSSHIELQDVGLVGDIPAHKAVVYSVPIVTSDDLSSMERGIVVTIRLIEKNGYGTETKKFSLTTSSEHEE